MCYYSGMKEFKDYKPEINKCSKCGLCESVCPLFKINPNDCVASKGKFLMLGGVINGDLKFSQTINKYLDMCLKCGKCKSFCPGGIDICEILAAAKYEYMKNRLSGKIINFLQSRPVFNRIIKAGEVLSGLFRPKKSCADTSSPVVVYFKGCVNKVFPKTDKALARLLKHHPVKIIEPDFECCGLPFMTEGNLERFMQVCKHNTEELRKYKYDYLITDCASCADTIASYPKYMENAGFLLKNSINWGDFIADENMKFKFKKPLKVTFHKPCHLENDEFFEKIMNNCENIEYVKMEDYDACCGFAGSFALKNAGISAGLISQKAENIEKTGADYVITTCPACIIGLKLGLAGKKTKVISLLEFLAMADKII